MKRLIAAVSFAILATPALAETGKPYEQLDVDRALPEINFPALEQSNVDPRSLPYEQTQADRTLPAFASDATKPVQSAQSPWANDVNFIAPAL